MGQLIWPQRVTVPFDRMYGSDALYNKMTHTHILCNNQGSKPASSKKQREVRILT